MDPINFERSSTIIFTYTREIKLFGNVCTSFKIITQKVFDIHILVSNDCHMLSSENSYIELEKIENFLVRRKSVVVNLGSMTRKVVSDKIVVRF